MSKVKNNECLESNIVYKTTVISQSDMFEYICTSSTELERRVSNHTHTIRNPNFKKLATVLCKLIWNLKNDDRVYTVQWEIVGREYSAQ